MRGNIEIGAHDGGKFSAYLSLEDGRTPRPAIVIAHEIFCVNRSMRTVADWFASEGFIVAVPDLFWRQQPGLDLDPGSEQDRQTGIRLLEGLDVTAAVFDIVATAEHLASHSSCNGLVGTIGYCMGGKLAYLTATERAYPGVSYYGVGVDAVMDRAVDLKARVLLHLPEEDALCPPETQERMKTTLAGNELVRISSHAGVGHAFARRNSPAYVEAAAEVADAQTLAFFRETLAG